MAHDRKHRSSKRHRQIEQLEQRIALTAHAVTDVQPNIESQSSDFKITTQLHDTNQSSGVDYVHENYGFDGSGQTIVVIDSGIAWDHYALGGGFGEGEHVVGGWDFAENDANPYDDGPAGYHGTHVSGIIGSLDDYHTGVASGADLVSLRVFDDYGQSNFQWVEQALQWVHDHRDEFENPITTVNLSLGVAWNSDSIPEWAQLEDEFAQLEADGIFVSVAAGNGFGQYNAPGLSYPAASPHVVPVASHGVDGQLSDFSQRNDRVLVAPGEDIYSTVPDHLFMGMQTGQFLRGSGTSMAAPYVAGASALLREAYGFMGSDDLTQEDLYNHFHETATQVYDSATNSWYDRLDLQAAIDAVVVDYHSEAWSQATDLGSLSENLSASGTIGKSTDVDAFSFTAEASGSVTLTFEQTHELQTLFTLKDRTFDIDGNTITFDVEAGQQYQFSMATYDGIGHYDVDLELTEASGPGFDPTDWGTVIDSKFDGVAVDGDAWFGITANQNGLVSILADHGSDQGSDETMQFEVYDESLNLIAASYSDAGEVRLDVSAGNGERLYLRMIGQSDSVDVRVVNLVGVSDGVATVQGTEGNDRFSFADEKSADGNSLQVSINGIAYEFSTADVSQLFIDGGAGRDTFYAQTGMGDDRIITTPEIVSITNQQFNLSAAGIENTTFFSSGGQDRVEMYDSQGDDSLFSTSTNTAMYGAGFSVRAIGFSDINAHASGGHDFGWVRGSLGDEQFSMSENSATMEGDNRHVVLDGFDHVLVDGAGGFDTVQAIGSEGSDVLSVGARRTQMQYGNSSWSARRIDDVAVDGRGGDDFLTVVDTAGDDVMFASADEAWMHGATINVETQGFEDVRFESRRGGNDQLTIVGTVGADEVVMGESRTNLTSASLNVNATGFDKVTVDAGASLGDTLLMTGTDGTDRLYWIGEQVALLGTGFDLRAFGFEAVDVNVGTGNDMAIITGSQQIERLTVDRHSTRWSGESFDGQLRGFENLMVTGQANNDEVEFRGFGADDDLSGHGKVIQAYLNDQNIYLRNFARLDAYAADGETATEDIGAVDYLFDLHGNWED